MEVLGKIKWIDETKTYGNNVLEKGISSYN